MSEKELIFQYAKEFRDAIEKVCRENLSKEDFFKSFPKYQCGIATILLGQYFWDKGLESWYVCGIKEDGKSHAWLTTKNPKETKDYYIIDITSDQFGDEYSKVYVGKINDFYKLYDMDKVRESWHVDNINGALNYRKLYDVIMGA